MLLLQLASTAAVQVREDQLEQLCDGSSDTTGLQWPLHVRSRLPLDLLSCLPGALKALGGDRGTSGASVGVSHTPEGEGEEQQEAQEEGVDRGGASIYQFRPQLQVGVGVSVCVGRVGGGVGVDLSPGIAGPTLGGGGCGKCEEWTGGSGGGGGGRVH